MPQNANLNQLYFEKISSIQTPSGVGTWDCPIVKNLKKNVVFSLRSNQCDFPKLHFFQILEHSVKFQDI